MKSSPECECGEVCEDFEHVLWNCPKYDGMRESVIRAMNRIDIRCDSVLHETKDMGDFRTMRLIGSFIKKCKIDL